MAAEGGHLAAVKCLRNGVDIDIKEWFGVSVWNPNPEGRPALLI